jgi:microcystin-dependent protein
LFSLSEFSFASKLNLAMKKQKKAQNLGAVEMGSIPLGTIVAFTLGLNNIPPGWLYCDGQSTSGYALYSFMKITPVLSGLTLIGSGGSYKFGSTGGEATHTLLETEMPSHQHFGWGEAFESNWGNNGSNIAHGISQSVDRTYRGSGKTDEDNYLYGSTFAGGNLVTTIDTTAGKAGLNRGTTSPHNNMQPYYVVDYIIYAGDYNK